MMILMDNLFPVSVVDNFFDILYGSSNFRKCLLNECNINEIFADIDNDIKDFYKLREKYLLY